MTCRAYELMTIGIYKIRSQKGMEYGKKGTRQLLKDGEERVARPFDSARTVPEKFYLAKPGGRSLAITA